jgi:hypothetical protein
MADAKSIHELLGKITVVSKRISELNDNKELLSGISNRLTDPKEAESISPDDMDIALQELTRAQEFLTGASTRITIANTKIGPMQGHQATNQETMPRKRFFFFSRKK